MSAVPDFVLPSSSDEETPKAQVIVLFPAMTLRKGKLLDVMGYCHANGCPNGDADGCHGCHKWQETE